MHSTPISSVGEFGLIRRIRNIVALPKVTSELGQHLLRSIGDDAAVYRPTPGSVQLLTTDALVEGVHFDLTFTSLEHLGWKAMAANISDIAAMGGTPRYAVVALGLPNRVDVEMVENLYRGMVACCSTYGCALVGGDTTASPFALTISVALTGESLEQTVTYRSGARPGQYICVSGHLGGSLAGLKILQREKQRYQAPGPGGDPFTPNLTPYAAALERYFMPRPRTDLAMVLGKEVQVGAVIDVSDGLASDMHRICDESGVGAEIHEHNIPVDGVTQKIAGEFGESATGYALRGGEDYELLFTIADAEYEKLDGLTNDVSIIGRVKSRDDGVCIILEQGERQSLTPVGWDHFG